MAAERRRLEKELAGAQRSGRRPPLLANADLLASARRQAIAKIRDRQRVAQQETERITTGWLRCRIDEFRPPDSIATGASCPLRDRVPLQVEHLLTNAGRRPASIRA